MTARRRLGVDMPKRGIQFVARRRDCSTVEQPRKHSGLVDSEKFHDDERVLRQGSSAVEQPRKHSGLVGSEKFHDDGRVLRQGSSAVEQGTHKPLVGSSILPSGTFRYGLGLHSAGRDEAPLHWFDRRSRRPFCAAFARTHCDYETTRWSIEDRREERGSDVKRGARNRTLPKIEKESGARNISSIERVEQPRKRSGLVGSSILPSGTSACLGSAPAPPLPFIPASRYE